MVFFFLPLLLVLLLSFAGGAAGAGVEQWVCASRPEAGPSLGDALHRAEEHLSQLAQLEDRRRSLTWFDRVPLLSLGRMWSDRVWEFREKPLLVVARTQTTKIFPLLEERTNETLESYPCSESEATSLLSKVASPWVSRCACEKNSVVCAGFGEVCVGAVFRAAQQREETPPKLVYLGERFAWDRSLRFAAGLLFFWRSATLADFALFRSLAIAGVVAAAAFVLWYKNLLWTQDFFRFPSLTVWGYALLSMSFFALRFVLKDLRRSALCVGDSESVYDDARGFFVRRNEDADRLDSFPRYDKIYSESHNDSSRFFATELAKIFSRVCGASLLLTSASDRTVALALTTTALLGPGLCLRDTTPDTRTRRSQAGLLDERSRSRLAARYTRDSLAALRNHLHTPDGHQALGLLAPHPRYARDRDAEINCFLDTGSVLYHGYHFEYE